MSEARKKPIKGSGLVPVDTAWLGRHREEIIEPDLPIVDAHHHLWGAAALGGHGDAAYLLEEYLADTGSGHRVIGTVYIETKAMYRADGPGELRAVGEIEFANGMAAMSASGNYGPTRVCAGIVGYVDLSLGAQTGVTLDAMCAASTRFRGIRVITPWDDSDDVRAPWNRAWAGMLSEPLFRAGFAGLAPRGLSFDAWVYFHQLPELVALARAFPATQIVLNHFGGPIGIGPYAGRRDQVFAAWRAGMLALGRCDNMHIKMGGIGMRLMGQGWHERDEPPTSAEIAAVWKPYVETCIEAFGTKRAMFESNYPVDRGSMSYHVMWNAFKRTIAGGSFEEKTDLLGGAARRFYRLDLPA